MSLRISEKVLLAHTHSKRRAQREDVLAAIAAKEAEIAASQQRPRPQPSDAQLSSAVREKKPNPKEGKRPDLRGEIFEADGDIPKKIFCLGCQDRIDYAGWARQL